VQSTFFARNERKIFKDKLIFQAKLVVCREMFSEGVRPIYKLKVSRSTLLYEIRYVEVQLPAPCVTILPLKP
jgi:hypothetical protein